MPSNVPWVQTPAFQNKQTTKANYTSPVINSPLGTVIWLMNTVNDDNAINEVISATEVKEESSLSVGVSSTKAVVGLRL